MKFRRLGNQVRKMGNGNDTRLIVRQNSKLEILKCAKLIVESERTKDSLQCDEWSAVTKWLLDAIQWLGLGTNA